MIGFLKMDRLKDVMITPENVVMDSSRSIV